MAPLAARNKENEGVCNFYAICEGDENFLLQTAVTP
jgi:hypothetical protein